MVLLLFPVENNKSRRGRPPRQLVYQRLEDAIADLRERMGGLPSPTEAEGIWTSIWYQEAHHSTALEGNTLVIAQVEALLAEGRAVGNKELKEYMEVTGYAGAAKWVYGQALDPGEWTSQAPLMMTEIRHVHELALGPVWGVAPHPDATPEEKPGSFRRHDIRPFPGGMVPPSWVEVPAAMVDWVDSLATIATSDNPVEAIAIAHAGDDEALGPGADRGVDQFAAHAGMGIDDIHAGQRGHAGEGKFAGGRVPADGRGKEMQPAGVNEAGEAAVRGLERADLGRVGLAHLAGEMDFVIGDDQHAAIAGVG